MVCVTYLSDNEVRRFRTVEDDKDCNDILQGLRKLTGEEWLIRVMPLSYKTGVWPFRKEVSWKLYTLYYGTLHGEYQVINLVNENGSTIFDPTPRNSRCHVMNYMLGYIAGVQSSGAWA